MISFKNESFDEKYCFGNNDGEKILIKQAQEKDIPIIESILLDTFNWLEEQNQQLWSKESIKWKSLSKSFQINNFYIAYLDNVPSGCVAIIDYDPLFWENIPKGESLYIHKLAVIKAARKKNISDALIDFFKTKGKEAGVKTLRLDTHAYRPKLRAFYEKHGFELFEERIVGGKFHSAFYILSI